jgi:hypothetical protein
MIDAGIPLSPSNRAVHKMFDAGFLGGVRYIFALLYFTPRSGCPEILDTVDAINAVHRSLNRSCIIHVSWREFDPLTS